MIDQQLDHPILRNEGDLPRSLVNMSDPKDVREAFKSLDNTDQPLRLDGKSMTFDNPYGNSDTSHWSTRRDLCDSSSGDANSSGSSGAGTDSNANSSGDQSAGMAVSDSGTGSTAISADLAPLEQQIMADLQQISQDLQQLTTELSQIINGGVSQPAGTISDNSSGTQTSGSSTDNTGSSQTSGSSTDNTGGSQTSGSSTDNTGSSQTSGSSTDNTSTQNSSAGYGSVSQYTAAAVIQQLQQSDPTLAKVVAEAQTAANQGQVSQAGFDLFAQNVGEAVANDGQSGIFQDDNTLLTTMASVGQSTSDSAALTKVVNNDMKSLPNNNISTSGTGDPVAETGLAAPGTVADLIAQNDYGQRGIVTADAPFYGSTGWAYGTFNMDPPGNLAGTDNVTPWGVVYQGKRQTENPNANVEVSDSTTYYHLKTGGWVEAQSPSQNQWWEANYSANFQSGPFQTNAQNQPNDTYEFAAPPAGDVDHFGPGNASFNPSLYDGVYTTMDVKADTPNSGLVMQLGADAYGNFTGHDADPVWGNNPGHHAIGNNNFIELTTNWQPVYYTSLSQSEIENDPPPGLTNADGSQTPPAVSG